MGYNRKATGRQKLNNVYENLSSSHDYSLTSNNFFQASDRQIKQNSTELDKQNSLLARKKPESEIILVLKQ